MEQPRDLLPRFLAAADGLDRAAPAIVAVSGGRDSVALLDLLLRAGFQNLAVAHFHHGLRGATAEADADFARAIAARRGLSFRLGRGDTRARARKMGESLEEAARALRRAFLARAARKHGASAVFLGHHAGDAAETLLFHLARGSGPRGMSALRTRAALDGTGIALLRPMLGFTPDEIARYADARRLEFRTDETNASRTHTRNRLRRDVLPALAEAVGFDPVPPMARAAAILADEDAWLDDLIADDARPDVLSTRALAAMPAARQRRVLRAWLRRRAGCEADFATVERARLLAQSSAPPAKMNLPRGHHLRRRAGQLFVEAPRRRAG